MIVSEKYFIKNKEDLIKLYNRDIKYMKDGVNLDGWKIEDIKDWTPTEYPCIIISSIDDRNNCYEWQVIYEDDFYSKMTGDHPDIDTDNNEYIFFFDWFIKHFYRTMKNIPKEKINIFSERLKKLHASLIKTFENYYCYESNRNE